ncbi:hypothetical protein ACFLTP_02230 [Chloroflexota bacterium]
MNKFTKTGLQVGLGLVLALSLALGAAVPRAKASICNDVSVAFLSYPTYAKIIQYSDFPSCISYFIYNKVKVIW